MSTTINTAYECFVNLHCVIKTDMVTKNICPNGMEESWLKKKYTSIDPPIAKTNFCVIKGTTSTPPKLVVTPLPTKAHYNGTQQWHRVHSPKVGRHPPPNHSTLQWHHVRSAEVGRHPPPNHSTLQWHPAMAPRPLPQSWSSPSPPPTIAHYNGTLQWHHVRSPKVGRHPPPQPHYNGTLQWHHVHSAKVGRHPPLPPP